MKTTATLVAALVALIGFAVWDAQVETCRIARDITMSGHDVLVKRCATRIGLHKDDRVIAFLD